MSDKTKGKATRTEATIPLDATVDVKLTEQAPAAPSTAAATAFEGGADPRADQTGAAEGRRVEGYRVPAAQGSPAHVGPPAPTLGDPILDMAAWLMGTPNGLDGVTIDTIAKAAGQPFAKVLEQYPTVDHIGAAIFEKVLSSMPEELGTELDNPLEDRLYAFLANDFNKLDPYKPFVAAITWHTANPLSPSFTLQAPVAARYIAYVTEQIREARARREIAWWSVPSLAAGAFWLLRMEALRFWVKDTSRSSARSRAHAHQLVRTFVAGLGGKLRITPNYRYDFLRRRPAPTGAPPPRKAT